MKPSRLILAPLAALALSSGAILLTTAPAGAAVPSATVPPVCVSVPLSTDGPSATVGYCPPGATPIALL